MLSDNGSLHRFHPKVSFKHIKQKPTNVNFRTTVSYKSEKSKSLEHKTIEDTRRRKE